MTGARAAQPVKPLGGPAKRDSGLGKEGKARQRERNGTGTGTTSGSSGKAKSVAAMPKIDFAEVMPVADHLCDIAGQLSHTQLGSSGWLSATLNIPLAYSHEVTEAHLQSQQGLVFFRVYHVTKEAYLRAAGELQDEGSDGGSDASEL